MKRKYSILLYATVGIVGIVAGIVIGRFIDNIPVFVIDSKIRIFEPLTFLLTFLIGIFIPLYIKRVVDDKRRENSFVIDDLNSLLSEVKSIQNKIKTIYENGSFTQGEKTLIQSLFEQTDLSVLNSKSLVEEFFKDKYKVQLDNLYKAYNEYWKHLTGSVSMSTKFKRIDEAFMMECRTLHNEFEKSVREIIVDLFKQ